MSRYAAQTEVPSDRSRSEIERTLARYGADQFLYGWREASAVVGFRMHGRMIRFVLPLPDRQSPEFTRTDRGKPRSPTAAQSAYEQAVRQRWRALALVIKAKLEAVETGIAEFEDEFLSQIVLPDGQTVSQFMRPQIALAYERGDAPAMLPDYSGGRP